MTCNFCNLDCVKAGRYGIQKIQRYKCKSCGKRFSEAQEKPLGDVRLPDHKVSLILRCLVEGNSVRGTARLCDVEKRTVLRILTLAGQNCERLLERKICNVKVEDVQIDEAWTFVGKKERRKTRDDKGRTDIGDQFVYVALEANSKMVLCWHLGRRDNPNTWDFITKLRDATSSKRFQLTSDAFGAYRGAINAGLHDRVDYAQQIKLYGSIPGGRDYYRPAKIKGTIKTVLNGRPQPGRITTSHIERMNGSLRQWCKRMTRLTYAFSRKLENLRASLALHFAYYNFCRVHSSLKVTRAMENGVTDHIWSIEELIAA